MKKTELKQIIKEILSENSEIMQLAQSPSDSSFNIPIKFRLDRKIHAHTAYYRLETDGWFRRYFNPGKGYGLMIRRFKVTGKAQFTRNTPDVIYPISVEYLPNEFDDMRDDIPANRETAKGILFINREVWYQNFNPGVVPSHNIKKLESFINSKINQYIP